MKYILLIGLLLSTYFCFSQTNQNNSNSNSTAPSDSQKYSVNTTQNLVQSLLHDTCLDKKFSIVFYLINDSNFILSTGPGSVLAIQDYSLSQIIINLNKAFKPICVQFEHCRTVIVPDYEYNKWKSDTSGMNDVIRNYYEKNVINIYLPKQLDPPVPDAPEESYTFILPPVPIGNFVTKDAIVIQRYNYSFGSGLMHVMGHYFGLPHTYYEKNPNSIPNPPPPTNSTPPIATLEYVDHANIQNCLDHGDGFCDTEADPYPAFPTPTVYPRGQIPDCGDAAGLKDGHGDFYILPYDNYMSHYGCRCKYTPQQYNYMAYMILTRRLYLH